MNRCESNADDFVVEARISIVLPAVLMVILAPTGYAAIGCSLQDETFEGYPHGSSLHGQGGWIGWENDPAFTALVTQEQALSPPQSVKIEGESDLVHPFCASGGAWSYSAWQYIPSDFESGGSGRFAGSYFILLNRHPVDANDDTDDWSVQLQFDSNDGMLKVYHGNGLDTVKVPYETDRWVKIQAVIDLDNDWINVYYDDQLVTEYPWTGGVLGNGGGDLYVAAVDLVANGASSIYYDDLKLEPIAPVPSCAEEGTARLLGDLNNDLYVDFWDLRLFAFDWLGDISLADIAPIEGDNKVDSLDYAVLAGQWRHCADPANPLCTAKPLTLYEPPSLSHPYASPSEQGRARSAETVGTCGIHGFSGEFNLSAVDLQISGRGLDFIWARRYRSRVGPATAMGNGWDYSYNIYLEPRGSDLILHDGNARPQRYVLRPDGVWVAIGYFRELRRQPDDSYTLTFRDTGTWRLRPLDGSPSAGKIDQITDRNGNSIRFEYDESGRLTTVRDTLDTSSNPRSITIGYNRNGFIESVTDFTGRSITYRHYNGAESGGNFGDLKSVTTPAVAGTPTGNDFPDGKTTVYTYSTGFDNECLNHNLLTITDPKGQPYLTNVYDPTTDLSDLNFDRVVSQRWGDPADTMDMVYASLIPDPANSFAVSKATVNDRRGHVSEHSYDNLNHLVIERRHTGTADPLAPTDLDIEENPPIGPLRIDDPNFFETRYQWNVDSLPVRTVFPNGDELNNVHEIDLDPDAFHRSRGNLRETRRLPGPLGGDQLEIVELFEYDTDPTGCCGSNFVIQHVDGRGAETLHTYDGNGNRTKTVHRIPSIVEDFEYNSFGQMTKKTWPDNGSGHRRIDVFRYYGEFDGCMNGYLKEEIIDEPGLALTTTYEYDCIGRIIRMTDPRGHDSLYEFNALDQIVREQSRRVSEPSGARYATDTYYDRNDNIVRIDVRNIDDLDVLLPNTDFTTIYEYDILNYLVRECREVGDYTGPIPGPVDQPTCGGLPLDDFIVTEYEYDANRNLTHVRSPEATSGNQPTNTVRALYDERDLIFQTIRAESDAGQSTTQYDYDDNGNLIRITQGLEALAAGQTPHVRTNTYDGYNRLLVSTDPMGNRLQLRYDENSNRIFERIDGELVDLPSDAVNIRLLETEYVYDSMDRRTREVAEFFDTETQALLDGGQQLGKVSTDTEYSDNSQIIRIIDDNLHVRLYDYDTANRISLTTDSKGNTRAYSYDKNSNITSVTEVERSDLGSPDQTFVTTYSYDGLDRRIRVQDNVGNTTEYDYDSRGNLTSTTDPLLNETRYAYDGLDRRILTVRDMDGDGAQAADANDIVIVEDWDSNSRLINQTDDNGNTTSYEYDSSNRLTRTLYADGTGEQSVYDVHDNVVRQTDAAGSIIDSTCDLLDRVVSKAVTTGPGVSNSTTFENYEYDGLSRTVRAEDDDTVVVRSFDSLSRATSETLIIAGGSPRTTSATYDGVGNQTSCTYPGGLQILTTYDELDRKSEIRDSFAPFTRYSYIGPHRVEKRICSPQFPAGEVHTNYLYDGAVPNPANDFGVKQIVRTTSMHIRTGTIIDDRAYTYDPLYNKTQRADLRFGGSGLTHDYTFDPMYRLIRTVVSDPVGTIVRNTDYALDGVGNRTDVGGAPNPGLYTMDGSVPSPQDQQMNQYTTTSFDSRLYDENGNLRSIDNGLPTQRNALYDYRNRMVEHFNPAAGMITTYTYDPMDRRVRKHIASSVMPPLETSYYYNGSQVIEEQDNSSTTQAQYIYGIYIDEVLVMLRGGSEHFCHTDDLYNITAVTDFAGNVLERYEYGDYGRPEFFDGAGNPQPVSLIGNPYLFNGRRYDPETGLYYYRNRYLDPDAGRFVQRDPGGIWADPANLGNPSTYVANNPWSSLDPFGLMKGDFSRGHQPDRRTIPLMEDYTRDILPRLAHRLWTDYDVHDPGITMYEVLVGCESDSEPVFVLAERTVEHSGRLAASHGSASKLWGTIPDLRVGREVAVAFSGGDPDQPVLGMAISSAAYDGRTPGRRRSNAAPGSPHARFPELSPTWAYTFEYGLVDPTWTYVFEEEYDPVFLRFVVEERAFTPSLGSSPSDALDAVSPSRLRDGYELELILRRQKKGR